MQTNAPIRALKGAAPLLSLGCTLALGRKDKMGNFKKQNKAKAVPMETRLVEHRSKIYKALCQCDKHSNISEYTTLLYELVDTYIDLVRLKIATKSLNL